MPRKQSTFRFSVEDEELFHSQKKQRGFESNSDYIRFLLYKDREDSALTSSESILKSFQNQFEEESYLTLRVVKAALIILYRNNLYLQNGQSDEIIERIREASLSQVNGLYETFEKEFKKG